MKLLDLNQPETTLDYLGTGLADALITRPEIVPAATRRRLEAITRRYWGDAP